MGKYEKVLVDLFFLLNYYLVENNYVRKKRKFEQTKTIT